MSSDLAIMMTRSALATAQLIAAAYKGRDAVRDLAATYPKSQFRYVDEDNWRAAMIGSGNTVYIGIAGTNDAQDWAINLSAHHDANTPMHAGYRHGAVEIMSELRRNGLRELIEDRDVVVGGHSSGGIMAQAMLHYAVGNGFQPAEIYTFGAPRGFSPEMANWINASPCKTFRFTMPGDPIPHVPLRRFRRLFAGAAYAHAGQEIRLHDDGRMEAEKGCGVIEKIKFGLMLMGAYSLKVTPFRIASVLASKHSIQRYLRALQAAYSQGASNG